MVKVQCDDGSQLGAPGPCQPSQLQFTEHSDAPRTTTGAGFTFSVDWTPPAANVGDIVFYAAGNAADGSASNLGDRVYTTVRRISPPCTLTAKPSVTSAVNGASFGAAWNSGAVMSIFGSNFAPVGQKRPLTQGDIVGQRLPQSLGCIAVAVNGQNAPMIYVGPDQVNVQAPALAAIGPATLVVIANPGTSNELRSDPLNTSTQQALAPAFFTFDGKSVAATSADGSRIIANAALIAGSVAAQPGAIVVMYGTGLGATNPVVSPGDIVQAAASVVTPLTITVGGVPLSPSDILYAGLSPQSPSCLYQFNIRLPATLPDGDIPVLISAGGVQSPPGTTIPVRR